jgi:hypothetical protein
VEPEPELKTKKRWVGQDMLEVGMRFEKIPSHYYSFFRLKAKGVCFLMQSSQVAPYIFFAQ